ncbi:MAG: site-2 protease family protein, partial [Thermoanaerobaculales bacterium]
MEVEIIGPDGVPVGVVRRPPPAPDRVWLHLLLLALTFASTTLVGGLAFSEVPAGFKPTSLLNLLLHPAVLRGGLLFSIPLLTILLAHEMGHYVACRYHRLNATLPFFIPVPFGIGTLGAFIRIRSPLMNKRELFDVGASGPLAGFIVALPVLFAGISLS